MYKVKGADSNEYGPISTDQVRQWIRENRLNRASLAEDVNSPGWKTLGEFPEFADLLAAPVTSSAMPGTAFPPGDAGLPESSRETALSLVKAPAIALIVWGWIYVAMGLWGLGSGLLGDRVAKHDEAMRQLATMPEGSYKEPLIKWVDFAMTYALPLNAVTLLMGALTAFGALRMLRLQNKKLAWAAAILSIQPCINPCCCFPMAFGIWALVVLCKREVSDNFK